MGGGDYNCGVSDAVAALTWVREHISSFGGDPAKVTVYGQSAGAMLLACLLACPRATGLFRGAVLQSGAGCNIRSKATADRMAARVAMALGLPEASVESLAAVRADTLFAVQRIMNAEFGEMAFQPVVDCALVRCGPLQAISAGVAVKLMVGVTMQESTLFAHALPVLPWSRAMAANGLAFAMRVLGLADDAVAAAAATLRDGGGDVAVVARAIVDAYPDAFPEAYLDLVSDVLFVAPMEMLCEAAGGRAFRFTVRVDGPIGSAHGVELPFLHGTHTHDDDAMRVLVGRPSPAHDALSRDLVEAWTCACRFAFGGARLVKLTRSLRDVQRSPRRAGRLSGALGSGARARRLRLHWARPVRPANASRSSTLGCAPSFKCCTASLQRGAPWLRLLFN